MTAGSRPADRADRADLRLGPPAAAAWIVAWQGRLLPPGALAVGAVVAVVTCAAVLLSRRSSRAAVVAATLACAAAAGLGTAARVHARTSGPLAVAAARHAAVVVEGVLVDDPRVVPASGDTLSFRELLVATVRVERLDVAGVRVRLRQPVVVFSSDRHWLGLLPSQRVRTEGRLAPAERGDEVAAVLSARGPPVVLGRASVVQLVAGHLRKGLRDAVRPLPDDERGLLPGLVDGDIGALDPRLKADFRATGLTHLVAVSGTNVAVVLGAALALCGLVGLPLRWRPPVATAALLAFVVLARPSPSVLRAAVMGGIAMVALATGSRRQALPALCGAVLILVLLSPELASQAGFALSTLATAGLLLIAPVWPRRLTAWLPSWLPRWSADALAVPAAAQLACTPVVVGISGSLGLLAVPANLLAVPAVAPATVLGVLAALVAPLSVTLAQAAAWLAFLPTRWLVLIAHTGADQPGASASLPSGWTGSLLVLAMLGSGAFVLRSGRLRRVAAAAMTGCLVAVLVVVVIRPAWPPPGWLLASCDVGQGDGFVVRVAPGTAVVIDAGPDPEKIDRCLGRLHIERIPLLVLTHLHADHVEGVPGLLRGRQVALVEIGPLDEPEIERRRLMGWLSERRIPFVRAEIGEGRSAGPVRWQVLDATARHGTDSDPNNSSIVIRLVTHGITVLFAGDLERDAQRSLLERDLPLTADVLKVPHHGSRKQDPDFLDAVHARIALTPVGAGNPYGHPDAGTLRRLESDGARTYRSDKDGDVAIVERAGRISSIGRGGNGVPPTDDHHGPQGSPDANPAPAALSRLSLPAASGSSTSTAFAPLAVPAAAMTLCDVAGPRRRSRAPP
ncbi:MAG: internalization-related competence protein ComEC/Rec2 [Frankiales bacterium]|nr:internalization-related competence protein ComEC/Rec2 [Frankiales bacterium]